MDVGGNRSSSTRHRTVHFAGGAPRLVRGETGAAQIRRGLRVRRLAPVARVASGTSRSARGGSFEWPWPPPPRMSLGPGHPSSMATPVPRLPWWSSGPSGLVRPRPRGPSRNPHRGIRCAPRRTGNVTRTPARSSALLFDPWRFSASKCRYQEGYMVSDPGYESSRRATHPAAPTRILLERSPALS